MNDTYNCDRWIFLSKSKRKGQEEVVACIKKNKNKYVDKKDKKKLFELKIDVSSPFFSEQFYIKYNNHINLNVYFQSQIRLYYFFSRDRNFPNHQIYFFKHKEDKKNGVKSSKLLLN